MKNPQSSPAFNHLLNVDYAIALVERTPARMFDMNRFAYNTATRAFFTLRYRPSEAEVRRHAFGVRVCLGGLIACDPHFQSQGLKRSKGGVPYMENSRDFEVEIVCQKLFGTQGLFCGTSVHPEDTPHKQLALKRLQRQRAKLVTALMATA